MPTRASSRKEGGTDRGPEQRDGSYIRFDRSATHRSRAIRVSPPWVSPNGHAEMRFIPCSADDRREMLASIGVQSIDDLLRGIPEDLRLRRPLDLPEAMSEAELAEHMEDLASANRSLKQVASFLGAGAYRHHVPA